MSRIQSTARELLELITLASANEASEGQLERLDQSLVGNAPMQRLFLDFCQLEADLRLREQASSALRLGMVAVDEAIAAALAPPADDASVGPLATGWQAHWQQVVAWANQPMTLAVTIATLTMTIVLLSLALIVPAIQPSQPNDMATAPLHFVARLVASPQAEWTDATTAMLAEGRDLYVGQPLELLSGTAVIHFDSGAEVRLRGPAVGQIDAPNAMLVESGGLSARVPPRAVGFAVSTPLAHVVDLGTEFSITADGKSGPTDIYVFEGSVQVAPARSPSGSSGKVRLSAGQALRVSNYEQPAFDELAFNNDAAKLRFRAAALDELAVLPAKEHLAVWLSAEHGVERDEQRRVQQWWPKYAAGESEPQACLPAADVPPEYVPSLFQGRASIEFRAATSLLSMSGIELEKEVTLAAVVWPQSGGGTRQMILRLQGAGVFGLDWNEKHQVRGRYFASAGDSPARTDVGVASADNLAAAPLLAVYSYSQPRDRAELFINGTSVAVAPAPTAPRGPHTLTLGGHPQNDLNFVGRVAEVMIFNHALAADEVKRLTRLMEHRYQLTQ